MYGEHVDGQDVMSVREATARDAQAGRELDRVGDAWLGGFGFGHPRREPLPGILGSTRCGAQRLSQASEKPDSHDSL